MTDTAKTGPFAKARALYCCFIAASNGLQGLAGLAMRLVMARMFLKSGILKLTGGNAADLFQYEWFSDDNWWMQLFGIEEIPRSVAEVLGALSMLGELVLPVLLILGLFTRFASAGLLAMTAVIILLVYPPWTANGLSLWWNDHVWWTVILLALLAWGPGNLSLDAWLGKTR